MIAHNVTLELYDQPAELLALDFETRRLIVRWGSGWTSCLAAFRLVACARCDSGDEAWARRVQTEIQERGCYACEGFGWSWHRESVPHGYRVEALAGSAGDRLCRDLGRCDECLLVRPVVDDKLERVVRSLRGVVPRSGLGHLRGVARWLIALERKLMHGTELIDALACEPAIAIGAGSESDDILGALTAAELIEPHAFDPKPGAIFVGGCGGGTWQPRAFARRCGNWPGHRDSKNSAGGPPEPGGSAAGAKHWYFQQGQNYQDIFSK